MHMPFNGFSFLDDKKYTIANVLPEVGAVLGCTYDLGDKFAHNITVEEILPTDQYSGKTEILAGRWLCPSEDSKGNHIMQELVDDHYAGEEIDPTGFANSMNYRNDMKNWSTWKFDPEEFDIDEARQRLQFALRSKRSVNSSAKSFMSNLTFGLPGQNPFSRLQETVATTPDPVEFAICKGCGKPDDLMRCSRCKGSWYYGKECQKEQWKKHRRAGCAEPKL
ncbi:hypothetical protein FPQ18DRAFT_104153 [Pyronema domesticum]|nr:hypothetical protein FPQ18DRAFT_104153 [Pyronema domesticum]